MLGEILQVGDMVVLNVPQENREWGYNPYPDGTIATFLRFSEIAYGWANFYGVEPGMYENTSWAYFRKNCEEICEYTGRAEMLDAAEAKRRDKSMRDTKGRLQYVKKRLSDLPMTAFIEGDFVTSPDIIASVDYPNNEAIIAQVHYDYIGQFCADGVTPMPTYSLTNEPNSWTSGINHAEELQLTLVRRGNVWKYRHGENIDWKNDEEHASFLNSLGLAREVRNPVNDLYLWTKEEAVQALKDNIGDCICVDNGMFGSPPRTSVKQFDNRSLGDRIRLKTIAGFTE
jgi:hypothetical protein